MAACAALALLAGTRSGYQGALVGFIAPLVLTLGPVSGLLFAATLIELTAPRMGASGSPVVRAPD